MLRLACESGFLEKVDEVCQYGQLVDEEAQILFQLQQYIPLRLEPARPSELEQYLLTPGGVNTEQALTSAVFGFVPPHNSVVVESEMTIGLPFDDEINAEIVELLFKGQSTFPISAFVPDRPTETVFPNFPFGRPPRIAANADEYFLDDDKKETQNKTNTETSQEEKSVPRKAPTKITVTTKKKSVSVKKPARTAPKKAPAKTAKKVTTKTTKKKATTAKVTQSSLSSSTSSDEEELIIPRKVLKKASTTKTACKASTTKTAKKKATTKRWSPSESSSMSSTSSSSEEEAPKARKVPKKALVTKKAAPTKKATSLSLPVKLQTVKLASVFGNCDNDRKPCKARQASTNKETLSKVFLAPTLVLVGQDVEPRKKIASFDMDSTLIKTLSGASM